MYPGTKVLFQGTFLLEFSMNINIKEPTVIYFNQKLLYQDGVNVELSPSNIATSKTNTTFIYISPTSEATDGQNLAVKVTRRA